MWYTFSKSWAIGELNQGLPVCSHLLPLQPRVQSEVRQFRPSEPCNGEKMCIDLVQARSWLQSLNTTAKCDTILLCHLSPFRILHLSTPPPPTADEDFVLLSLGACLPWRATDMSAGRGGGGFKPLYPRDRAFTKWPGSDVRPQRCPNEENFWVRRRCAARGACVLLVQVAGIPHPHPLDEATYTEGLLVGDVVGWAKGLEPPPPQPLPHRPANSRQGECAPQEGVGHAVVASLPGDLQRTGCQLTP